MEISFTDLSGRSMSNDIEIRSVLCVDDPRKFFPSPQSFEGISIGFLNIILMFFDQERVLLSKTSFSVVSPLPGRRNGIFSINL